MNTTTTTTKRWIAGFVIAAGLGTALFAGSAVASAEPGAAINNDVSSTPGGATVGPVNDGVSGRNLQEQVGVKVNRGLGGVFTPSPNIRTAGQQIVGDYCARNSCPPPK
jgi:hypothetical protein